MSNDIDPDRQPDAAGSGAILKQARESRGLHISVLATSLRVPVDRIRALESEQWNDLPDLVFARALAMSVCRHLKIDSAPVLAGMPDPDPMRSVRVTAAISQPLGGVVSNPSSQRPWWALLLVVVLALAAWLALHLDSDSRPSAVVETPGMPPGADPEPATNETVPTTPETAPADKPATDPATTMAPVSPMAPAPSVSAPVAKP